VQQFIHAQSDLIMHGFFGRRRKGKKDRDRIISFDGTDEVMAGTRIRQVYIPNKYIVTPPTLDDLTGPWKQWSKFFSNSPEAGEKAEHTFINLFEGVSDETIEKQEKQQNNAKEETHGERNSAPTTANKTTNQEARATAGAGRGGRVR
jgi:hypothetical protein